MPAFAGLTDYAENKVLTHFLPPSTTFTTPAAVYAGLFSLAPDDDGTGGVEIGGTGYARPALTFGAYAARALANSASASWNNSGLSAWPQAVAIGIWDAATDGNLLAVGTLTPQPTIGAGLGYTLLVGELTVTVNTWGPYLVQRVLEILFKATQHAAFTTVNAHLYTVEPDNDGAGGTEVTLSDYAAQSVTFAPYSLGERKLATDKQFTAAAPSPGYGTIVGAACKTGANFLGRGSIAPAQTVVTGAGFTLLAAQTAAQLE